MTLCHVALAWLFQIHLKATSSLELCSDLSLRSSLQFEFPGLFPSPSFLYPVLFCWFSPTHSLRFSTDTTFSEKSFSVFSSLGCVFCPRSSHIMHTFSVIIQNTSSHCIVFTYLSVIPTRQCFPCKQRPWQCCSLLYPQSLVLCSTKWALSKIDLMTNNQNFGGV